MIVSSIYTYLNLLNCRDNHLYDYNIRLYTCDRLFWAWPLEEILRYGDKNGARSQSSECYETHGMLIKWIIYEDGMEVNY